MSGVQAPMMAVAVADSPGAVSWAAIIGGAVAAAALTLVLFLVGTGLGFAALSPWPNAGASPTTFTVLGGIWLIITQWLSSGVGGYVTGRLRTRWVGPHTHEMFFRDTAHGFLAWALATLIGAAVVAASVGSVAAGGARAVTALAAGAAANPAAGPVGDPMGAMDYRIDRMFRTEAPPAMPDAGLQAARTEALRIAVNAARTGELPVGDRSYLAQLVATRSGIPQADAEKRVDAMIDDARAAARHAREAADTARKAASAAAIFTAVSMLVGAFIACTAAAYGGSSRDDAV